MIVVKLMGGLGNQMFQYACARSMIKDNEIVYIDLKFLIDHNFSTELFTSRNYELGIFKNCKIGIISNLRRRIFLNKGIFYKIIRGIFFNKVLYYKQKENEYNLIPTNFRNVYLDGYFQSEKYFQSIRNIIFREFTFPNLDYRNEIIKKQIIKENNPVSIHIRRGDYLKKNVNDYHGVLPLSYFLKAIAGLKQEFDNVTYYFFSDDTEYIRKNFSELNPKTIIDNNIGESSWKDMYLMRICKHHIISNSSFSWWAAWLSNGSGITIAPKKWFNPALANYDINDIIPSEWKILE